MFTTIGKTLPRRLPLLIAAALAAAAAPATAAALSPPQDQTIDASTAAQTLNQSWALANDATVEVHNVRGSVEVTAGDAGQATLTGQLGAGSKLVVAGGAQHLELRVDSDKDHWFGNHGPREDSKLVLKVPAGIALRLELVSADARVSGIDGKSLNVEGVSGKLALDSGAPEVEVESVSGNVTLSARRPGADNRLHVQSVSGDIDLTGASGRVKLETVSGRARASGNEVQEFESGTVSGDVEFAAALGKHARVQAETMSGEIRVLLPPELSAHIEAESFSGRIRSDFGTVEKPEFGPGSSLSATLGGGDAQVSAKSFSGNVDILKRP